MNRLNHLILRYKKGTIGDFLLECPHQRRYTLHLRSTDGASLLLVQPLQNADLTEDVVAVQCDRASDRRVKTDRALLQVLQSSGGRTTADCGVLLGSRVMTVFLRKKQII